MFDRVSEAAEKLATNVSRRAFMGRLGKGALTIAGAVGAFLAIPGLVQAGGGCACPSGSGFCCQYQCPDGSIVFGRPSPPHNCACKPQYKGCTLLASGCICGA
jgi:hypothetical protein